MEWLNYHHLLYFWTVARAGRIARACRQLRLAQPTISGQIRALEDEPGREALPARRPGPGADRSRAGGLPLRRRDLLHRPRADRTCSRAAPRPAARRASWSASPTPCPSSSPTASSTPRAGHAGAGPPGLPRGQARAAAGRALLARARPRAHRRASRPRRPACAPTATSSAILRRDPVRRARRWRARCRRNFPASLDGAPFLLPLETSTLRGALEQWFEAHGIRPRVAGEFQDTALLKTFGQAGIGVFAAPVGHRKGGAAVLSGLPHRPPGGRCRALLRHLRRAQAQAPGRPRHLRDRPHGAVPRMTLPPRPAAKLRRLKHFKELPARIPLQYKSPLLFWRPHPLT